MASVNKKPTSVKTHGNGYGHIPNAEEQLKRSVMSCMLWEDNFYESGESISDRIISLTKAVPVNIAIAIMKEAKHEQKLRHAPLLMARALASTGSISAVDLSDVITRVDDITEFMALYWKDKKQPISHAVQKGLSLAFEKFDEYQFAKYNRKKEVKLRDILRLVHPKTDDKKQNTLYGKIVHNELKTPDTWEVALSSGADKKETFERLLLENKLGDLAFLRNLRNIVESGIDLSFVKENILSRGWKKIIPFQFVTAAKYCPMVEVELEQALFKSIEKVSGKTIVIVDVSGSMYHSMVSKHSDADRATVACSLAMIAREMYQDCFIFATAGSDCSRIHKTQLVPSRHGFALKDAIYSMCSPLGGGGIFVKQVMDYVKPIVKDADRIIIITDEQDCDTVYHANTADFFGKENYIINVSTYECGVAYGSKTVHINGWSEKVLDYINTPKQ